LWSLHPKYLDRTGLVALWREGLLAQNVLLGKTKGYQNHPQLKRFRDHPHPEQAIAAYLTAVWWESQQRGYRFDRGRIRNRGTTRKIPVTRGQLIFEHDWLGHKLRQRDPCKYQQLNTDHENEPHPLFKVIAGAKEIWEKGRIPDCA
jgi:hypothetical protein